jgi:hypothetical protein
MAAEWFDDYADEEDELQIDEYDITDLLPLNAPSFG